MFKKGLLKVLFYTQILLCESLKLPPVENNAMVVDSANAQGPMSTAIWNVRKELMDGWDVRNAHPTSGKCLQKVIGCFRKFSDKEKKLDGADDNGNRICSPYSMTPVTVIMMEGMDEDGPYYKGAMKFFGAQNYDLFKADLKSKKISYESEHTTVKTANYAYFKEAGLISNSFKEKVKDYDADVKTLISKDQINNDVYNVTGISKIMKEQINKLTELVLVNVIFFKAEWENKFTDACKSEFYQYTDGTQGKRQMVQMMHRVFPENNGFRVYVDGSVKVIRMPYKSAEKNAGENSRYAFIAVVPKDGKKLSDASAFLKKHNFGERDTVDWRTSHGKLSLKLPTFEFEFEIDLLEKLQNTDLAGMLSDKPDIFPHILEGKQPLTIAKFIQKAKIMVDKNGSEASAATLISVPRGGSLGTKEEIHFTRPFHFIIVDNETKVELFAGTVTTPIAPKEKEV